MISPKSIIEKACERHGGVDAFSSLGPINVQLVKMAGLVPRSKGLGLTFSLPRRIVVDPTALTAEFQFENGSIAFDNGSITSNGTVKTRYRETFDGVRKLRFWSPEDACYFFGDALVGYFGLPFALRGRELQRCGRSPNGLSWVQAAFPPGSDTHCQTQRFWFDDSGLLVRHDYCADIIGPMFWGAHFSEDYCFDYAVPLAKRRTVKLRLGRSVCPIPVLHAQLDIKSVG